MSLAELLKKDLVRKTEPDEQRAEELLSSAERDLKAARDNITSSNYDWALAIAYHSMLSAGHALMAKNSDFLAVANPQIRSMAKKGYLPVSESHHLAVVQFCAAILPSESIGLAKMFNRYRVRRHDVVYGTTGSVGKDEAKSAIINADNFITQIKKVVK